MSIADINLFMFNTERNDMTIESNKKFKIKYTKQNGEEVRRFGIITDKCRGLGKRIKDLKPF